MMVEEVDMTHNTGAITRSYPMCEHTPDKTEPVDFHFRNDTVEVKTRCECGQELIEVYELKKILIDGKPKSPS